MPRPPTFFLAIAALILAIYGSWSLWKGVEARNWVGAVFGAVSLASGVGAMLRQAWSRWLALVVATLFTISWAYATWLAIETGAFALERPLVKALALVPGLAMIATGFICAYILFSFFSRSRGQA